MVAVLGKTARWKSEFEVLLIRGCEAVMLTINPKLLGEWFLTGNAKGKIVRCFSFPFGKFPALGLSDWILAIGSASYSATVPNQQLIYLPF